MRLTDRRPRVLLAVSQRAAFRIARILCDREILQVDSTRGLARALEEAHFDMVIVGTHFDQSNALDAINMVRARAPGVPLVCVRGTRFCTPLGDATLVALRSACNEIGVDCFLDLIEYPDDAVGDVRARAMLEGLLLA